MDLAEFQDLVDRCGDDIGRWPPGRRAAAEALLKVSAEARARLDEAAALKRLFAAERPGAATPPDLAARILARAAAGDRPPPPSGGPGRLTAWMATWLTAAARPAVAAGFACCFVAGFALGSGVVSGGRDDAAATLTAAAELFQPILR